MAGPPTTVLAVAGGKGGSGKTTTALGVASALAQRRRRPLVVDCDLDAPNPPPPRERRAGPRTRRGRPSHGRPGILRRPRRGRAPRGDADGATLESVLPELPGSRPVVLDCPAGASEAAARPLRAADGCLVVATRGRESVEDAVKTAAMARAVGTPVRAVAVSRERSVPSGLAGALDAPRVVPVPEARDPSAA